MSANSEIPTFKVIPIETPVAGTAYENFDFVKKCATEYSSLAKTQEHPKLVGQLIFQLEEDEIVALKDPEGASYKTLEATMQPIMDTLQCNIVVVVGHNTACFTYIDTNEIPSLNSLPTIVLVVACFSATKIAEYNTKPLHIQRKLFFFGFRNIMHLVQGEILACKAHHLAEPFLDCRFEEVKQDLEVIQANLTQYTKPYANQVDLLKCCKGRYEHFKQVFYDYLAKRECVKFPTASLLTKLRTIRNSDGTLFRNATMEGNSLKMTDEQLRSYIFKRSEGIPCTDEGNCSAGKTNYEVYKENLKKFDDRVRYGNAITKKLIDILNNTDRYTVAEKIEKDKEIVELLKSLPKPSAKQTLLHLLVYRNHLDDMYLIPLFFYIFAENYKLSSMEVLKNHDVPYNYIPSRMPGQRENIPQLSFVKIILNHMNRKFKKPTLTEMEAYRLIRTIGLKKPEIFLDSESDITKYGRPTIHLTIIDSIYSKLSISELLFYHFPEHIDITNSWLISRLAVGIELNIFSIKYTCKLLELLGSFQKLRLEKDYSFLTTYESISSKSFFLEILILIYVYFDDARYPNETIDEKIEFWTSKIESVKGEHRKTAYRKYLKIYLQAKDFLSKNSIESLRNTPAQMKELLKYDLAPFEDSALAIDEIKSYFGSVQKNIQKRKNLDADTKIKAIQNLVTAYKGVNIEKNEGENSLRRLKEIDTYYTNFLKEHPRANITNPAITSIQEPTKPTVSWLYDKIEAYKASLKKVKKTTARRPRKVVVLNSTNLQRELNNISSRLSGHNSGVTKLHHMTVKSLRRKKAEAEQKLRNLAPVAVAAAGNNGRNNTANNAANNAANNQAGGRTRKLRR